MKGFEYTTIRAKTMMYGLMAYLMTSGSASAAACDTSSSTGGAGGAVSQLSFNMFIPNPIDWLNCTVTTVNKFKIFSVASDLALLVLGILVIKQFFEAWTSKNPGLAVKTILIGILASTLITDSIKGGSFTNRLALVPLDAWASVYKTTNQGLEKQIDEEITTKTKELGKQMHTFVSNAMMGLGVMSNFANGASYQAAISNPNDTNARTSAINETWKQQQQMYDDDAKKMEKYAWVFQVGYLLLLGFFMAYAGVIWFSAIGIILGMAAFPLALAFWAAGNGKALRMIFGTIVVSIATVAMLPAMMAIAVSIAIGGPTALLAGQMKNQNETTMAAVNKYATNVFDCYAQAQKQFALDPTKPLQRNMCLLSNNAPVVFAEIGRATLRIVLGFAMMIVSMIIGIGVGASVLRLVPNFLNPLFEGGPVGSDNTSVAGIARSAIMATGAGRAAVGAAATLAGPGARVAQGLMAADKRMSMDRGAGYRNMGDLAGGRAAQALGSGQGSAQANTAAAQAPANAGSNTGSTNPGGAGGAGGAAAAGAASTPSGNPSGSGGGGAAVTPPSGAGAQPAGAAGAGGTPQAAGLPGGTPQAAGLSGGTPQAAGLSGGTPQAAGLPGGTPQAAGLPGGTPQAAGLPGGTPQAAGLSGGTPQAAGLSGGTPQAAGLPGGTPQAAGLPGGNVQGSVPAGGAAPTNTGGQVAAGATGSSPQASIGTNNMTTSSTGAGASSNNTSAAAGGAAAGGAVAGGAVAANASGGAASGQLTSGGAASNTQASGQAASGEASSTQTSGEASSTQASGQAASGEASSTQTSGEASSTQASGQAASGEASSTQASGEASSTQASGEASSTQTANGGAAASGTNSTNTSAPAGTAAAGAAAGLGAASAVNRPQAGTINAAGAARIAGTPEHQARAKAASDQQAQVKAEKEQQRAERIQKAWVNAGGQGVAPALRQPDGRPRLSNAVAEQRERLGQATQNNPYTPANMMRNHQATQQATRQNNDELAKQQADPSYKPQTMTTAQMREKMERNGEFDKHKDDKAVATVRDAHNKAEMRRAREDAGYQPQTLTTEQVRANMSSHGQLPSEVAANNYRVKQEQENHNRAEAAKLAENPAYNKTTLSDEQARANLAEKGQLIQQEKEQAFRQQAAQEYATRMNNQNGVSNDDPKAMTGEQALRELSRNGEFDKHKDAAAVQHLARQINDTNAATQAAATTISGHEKASESEKAVAQNQTERLNSKGQADYQRVHEEAAASGLLPSQQAGNAYRVDERIAQHNAEQQRLKAENPNHQPSTLSREAAYQQLADEGKLMQQENRGLPQSSGQAAQPIPVQPIPVGEGEKVPAQQRHTQPQTRSAQGQASTQQGGSAQGQASTQQGGSAQGQASTQQGGSAQGQASTQQGGSAQGQASTQQGGSAQGQASTRSGAEQFDQELRQGAAYSRPEDIRNDVNNMTAAIQEAARSNGLSEAEIRQNYSTEQVGQEMANNGHLSYQRAANDYRAEQYAAQHNAQAEQAWNDGGRQGPQPTPMTQQQAHEELASQGKLIHQEEQANAAHTPTPYQQALRNESQGQEVSNHLPSSTGAQPVSPIPQREAEAVPVQPQQSRDDVRAQPIPDHSSQERHSPQQRDDVRSDSNAYTAFQGREAAPERRDDIRSPEAQTSRYEPSPREEATPQPGSVPGKNEALRHEHSYSAARNEQQSAPQENSQPAQNMTPEQAYDQLSRQGAYDAHRDADFVREQTQARNQELSAQGKPQITEREMHAELGLQDRLPHQQAANEYRAEKYMAEENQVRSEYARANPDAPAPQPITRDEAYQHITAQGRNIGAEEHQQHMNEFRQARSERGETSTSISQAQTAQPEPVRSEPSRNVQTQSAQPEPARTEPARITSSAPTPSTPAPSAAPSRDLPASGSGERVQAIPQAPAEAVSSAPRQTATPQAQTVQNTPREQRNSTPPRHPEAQAAWLRERAESHQQADVARAKRDADKFEQHLRSIKPDKPQNGGDKKKR